MKLTHHHLAYCTNVHPAETWQETFQVLKSDVLAVRDQLLSSPEPFAIGLRLSARAAEELLAQNHLDQFQHWLENENCYVFTINGFPYGAFHGTSVKEKVYQPDWTTEERLTYTNHLFTIIAALCPENSGGSVSSLPGSFKAFEADEILIFNQLEACARHIETLATSTGKDLHLGLEPEPLGHFENTEETIAFFQRFLAHARDPELIQRRIGVNYDTCHFALQFEPAHHSLQALLDAGLRLSKIHLSNAISLDPCNPEAITAIRQFDEPTYLHQVILQDGDSLTRYQDLPHFLEALPSPSATPAEARCHFHIPLYSSPLAPLSSTLEHAAETLRFLITHPSTCSHLEIETYTWGVLPASLQKPLTEQICSEYQWVFQHLSP